MAEVQEDFTKMVTHLFKSGEEMQKELTIMDLELIHAILGVSGEADEMITAINENDRENMVEELGDLEFYLNKIRTTLGLPEHCTPREEELDPREQVFNHSEEFLPKIKDDLNILAGRILDIIKKVTIYRKPMNLESVADALQDFDTVLECAYRALGTYREEILEYNIKKLGKRYQNGYSNQAAQDRADKQ